LKQILKLILIALLTNVNLHGQEVDLKDTRLLNQPAVSQDQIAFVYAGDLWIAKIDGTYPHRLTAHQGVEFSPAFSPDGKLIAFSAEYEGNVDVYIIPVSGGLPTRLTWHPGPDIVQGFTPLGEEVLFASSRAVFTQRHMQLFKVPVKGGFPEVLSIPNATKGSYSPDGSRMAYTPLNEAFNQWKHYRGGTVSTISIFSFSNNSTERIPQPEGRCNDTDPMWIGDKIYFRSDRNGEFNIYSFEIRSKGIRQLTQHSDFPVIRASSGAGNIIYEQAGYLHLLNPKTAKSTRLRVGIASDLVETRPRFVKGTKYIRNGSVSPTGARVALEFRGEILTVPAEKGDSRNLTNTPGAHERSPVWSPDGKKIAYFSDESGEYELHVKDQDGKGQARKIKLNGAGFYEDPVWSPDSKRISYTDNSWSLYWLDLTSGISKKIGSEYLYGPSRARTIHQAWAPDSRWIAYTLSNQAKIQAVYVYSTEQDRSYAITDGMSDVSDPAFDSSGKYLYFLGSTDAGPVKQWFEMSNADSRVTRSFYLAVLRKDIPNPFAKESDEEKGPPKEEKSKEKETTESEGSVSIDFDGMTHRILSIPLPTGNFYNLQTGSAGQIYYLEDSAGITPAGPAEGKTTLHHYDLNKRKDDVMISDVQEYELSRDKKKIFYRFKDTYWIVSATEKPQPGQGKLAVDTIEVRIEPRAEWKQIFDEAWRINRDYFYDPNMHGTDWNAMKEKSSVFLPYLATRADLNRIIQWMCSELSVGHHRVDGGDRLNEIKNVPGGLLGADYTIENGRYRFRKVYGGLNWNPELHSPLTEPGVNVEAGEYLLSVRGQDLRTPENLYRFFENTAGKIVELTVGPNPDGTGSRTVSVVPVADESALRNRDWVEGNLKKVNDATAGRVAYVYVPNTSVLGYTYFKRYFFPQTDKQAIIIDERFNMGGQVADYYIDLLRRPFVSYWATRYGADIKTPGAAIQGPKVMLINETAGSGGDLFPWMFRKFKVGKLIGKRTWGGLVGVLGFPILMDGGRITAPNIAIWTEDGWVVENEGVSPDIEVEQTPAEVIAGHDPQLEKAIQVVMEELKKIPPKELKRPPYPIKVRSP